MAEEASTREVVVPTPSADVSTGDAVVEHPVKETEGASDSNGVQNGTAPEVEMATSAGLTEEENKDSDTETKAATSDKHTAPDSSEEAPSAAPDNEVEMKDAEQSEAGGPKADGSAEPADAADAAAGTPSNKSKARRKSGVPEHKKKLNKKQSKAKMTHIDAKPGDYFFVRLKGFPLWPAIVCDEDMLPSTLIKSRPVTAKRADGTYRADYEDGGPKAKDRTFAVMYLYTNEFGWIPNYDLIDLDFDTVADVPQNMRKDLYAAHQLAAEKHDLEYFKAVLTDFMEAKQANEEAKEAAKAAKKAKKEKKEKAPKVAASGADKEDIEMMDASAIVDDDEEVEVPKSSQKKRKNPPHNVEAQAPPDSVPKKPRIKLNNTPKAAVNGASTPKSTKEPKAAKEKPKTKKTPAKPKEPAPVVPSPEPELSPEEKRLKKEKEILFLRHKLQKGLLTKDQAPKEEEMSKMSEYVNKLEAYADLEVSIIRATKINKVLKAILKLSAIPKEEEFQFKKRSQVLLDKWNQLLASEQVAPAGPDTTANGTSEEPKTEKEETKAQAETANGATDSDEKMEETSPALETPLTALPKEEITGSENPTSVNGDSPKEAESAAVESTA